ncbi:MAG TPA: hypothetical protein VMN60_04915 [Longimicrobiales bacterium]|nr:hypothetical protein [Longimicrobiales bacterium]
MSVTIPADAEVLDASTDRIALLTTDDSGREVVSVYRFTEDGLAGHCK